MTDFQPGPVTVYPELTLSNFDVEISNGTKWVTLNDHFKYRVGAESFKQQNHPRRRISVTSPIYDGTFETHSVKENVDETVEVFVVGQSNNEVTENLLSLIDLFEQSRYSIRRRFDDHRETWSCLPAEYNVDRSFVNAHNVRAVVTFNFPRFPAVAYEVIL
jgi:hypothetical protein